MASHGEVVKFEASLAALSHQDGKQLQRVAIRFCNEVWLAVNHVPERDQQLDQDRNRVSLGVWLDGSENVTGETVTGCLTNGARQIDWVRDP